MQSLKSIATIMPLAGISVLGGPVRDSTSSSASPSPFLGFSEDGVDMIMRKINSKMTEVMGQSMLQLDDVLFLNGSRYGRQLRSQASGFKSRVILKLRDDLTRIESQMAEQKRA